jgi:hypothetical protein
VLVACAAAVTVWVLNPFAAALLVPALHAWMLALSPEVRLGRAGTLALALVALVPPVLVAISYGSQLDLGPLDELWMGALLVAGGGVSLGAALGWSVVLGCVGGVVAALVRARGTTPDAREAVSVRGPVSYAGPGSLGGTESALRR